MDNLESLNPLIRKFVAYMNNIKDNYPKSKFILDQVSSNGLKLLVLDPFAVYEVELNGSNWSITYFMGKQPEITELELPSNTEISEIINKMTETFKIL